MPSTFNQIFAPGFALQDGDKLNRAFAAGVRSSENAITALGNSKATAYQLSAAINEVSVAAANSGVILPPAVPGGMCVVFQDGASTLTIYGNGSDLIDAAASVPLTATKRCMYFCFAPGAWLSAQLGVASA